MNVEALEHWFESHEIAYEWDDRHGAFILRDRYVLRPDTLKEIGACKAQVRIGRSGRIIVEDS